MGLGSGTLCHLGLHTAGQADKLPTRELRKGKSYADAREKSEQRERGKKPWFLRAEAPPTAGKAS